MKRILASLLILVPAFFILSQNGAEAVAPKLFDRFASGKPEGESGVYTFDKAHSTIGFRVRHTGLIEVPGYFRDFKGSINYDANNVAKSTVEFTAKATSVDTGVAPRDNHLRTADFFEVEKYPDITFKSTKVEKKGKMWMVTGDLTMKAVTKSISFPFQIVGFLPAGERSGAKMGVSAETTINRKDYGLNYDSKLPGGIPAVSDDIKINLQIEAGMPKAAPAAATK